jgi:hypothetical protein
MIRTVLALALVIGLAGVSCTPLAVVHAAELGGRHALSEREAEQRDREMRRHIEERNKRGDWTCDPMKCPEGFVCVHEDPNVDTGVCRKTCATQQDCDDGTSCSSLGEDAAACRPDARNDGPPAPLQ